MTPPKEINNTPIANPKEIEIYKLSEFRIILLRKFKLNEL